MEDVFIIRSRKRKTVGIQVLQDATVKVTIPYFFPKFFVSKVLKEKEVWIRSAQQKMLSRPKPLVNAGSYLYLGKPYQLELRPRQKEVVEISDKLYVASANKKYVSTYLTSWYKQKAREIITKRVYHYAKIAGLSFRSIAITTAETRWG